MEVVIGFFAGAVIAFAWAVRNVCKFSGTTAKQGLSVASKGSIGGGGGVVEPY